MELEQSQCRGEVGIHYVQCYDECVVGGGGGGGGGLFMYLTTDASNLIISTQRYLGRNRRVFGKYVGI